MGHILSFYISYSSVDNHKRRRQNQALPYFVRSNFPNERWITNLSNNCIVFRGSEPKCTLWEFCLNFSFWKPLYVDKTLPEVWLCEKVMARHEVRRSRHFSILKDHVRLGFSPRVRGWSSSLIASEQVFGVASIHPHVSDKNNYWRDSGGKLQQKGNQEKKDKKEKKVAKGHLWHTIS